MNKTSSELEQESRGCVDPNDATKDITGQGTTTHSSNDQTDMNRGIVAIET